MSRANEFYSLDRVVRTIVAKLEASSDTNRATLLRYYRESVAEGLSLARVRKRVYTMWKVSQMLGLPFESATREDIVQLVMKIEQKKWKPTTKQDYKKILKQFYRWLKGGEEREAPPEVKWIKPGRKPPSSVTKKDLLTTDEVNSIVEAAEDIQTKAILAVMFDCAGRLGEILGLRICDVQFDRIGAKLRVDGKVGQRIAQIGAATPRLALWLDNHPCKCDPQSPLWVTVRAGRARQMSYASLRGRLKRAAEKACIGNRVWSYVFRHSRYRQVKDKLRSRSKEDQFMRWVPGSNMYQYYAHLDDEDLESAYLQLNGSENPLPDPAEAKPYASPACPRCSLKNPPDAKFCNSCGLLLDSIDTLQGDGQRDPAKAKLDQLSTTLAKSPDLVDVLLGAVALLKRKEGPKELDYIG